MSNKPIISVIVPVYGVEKYIAKCLLSIQQQTFTDFECIVVDDGSPDSSAEIGRKAVEGDERFVFVSKPNGGLASARNFGLDRAKGDYIAFVDSDDWVESEFLELPYKNITRGHFDICIFGLNYIDEMGNILDKVYPRKHIAENTDLLLTYSSIVELVSVSKLYSKKHLENTRFDEEILTYEDVTFSLRAMFNSKITIINEALYNYLQRLGTLSKDIKPSFLSDRLKIVKFKEQLYLSSRKDRSTDDSYYVASYLKDFVFHAVVKYARYSKNYSSDIRKLKKEIDYQKFTFKNIFFMIKQEKKVGLSLLLFKLSPSAFRAFARFWFRNKSA